MESEFAWSSDDTECLVVLWSHGKIQKQFESVSRNRGIWKKIAKDMELKGFKRTWEQCKNRITYLRKRYTDAKKCNMKSGSDRKTSPFYDEFDSVLGKKALYAPGLIIDTSKSQSNDDQKVPDDSDPSELNREAFGQPGCEDEDYLIDVDNFSVVYDEGTEKLEDEPEDNSGTNIRDELVDERKERKQPKKRKRSAVIEDLIAYQQESDRKFLKHESQRFQQEMEFERQMRREEAEREERRNSMLMSVLAAITNLSAPRQQHPQNFSSQPTFYHMNAMRFPYPSHSMAPFPPPETAPPDMVAGTSFNSFAHSSVENIPNRGSHTFSGNVEGQCQSLPFGEYSESETQNIVNVGMSMANLNQRNNILE